jgi:hypothetical protein
MQQRWVIFRLGNLLGVRAMANGFDNPAGRAGNRRVDVLIDTCTRIVPQ